MRRSERIFVDVWRFWWTTAAAGVGAGSDKIRSSGGGMHDTKTIKSALFADDILIYCSGKTPTTLAACLKPQQA